MSNWFTPEQQTQLEALNSQIWADEVASRIKKLWIEDNFKAKAAATTQVTTPTQIEANKQVSDLKVPEVTTSVQETPSETTPVIKKDTVVATEVKAPVQSPKDVKTTPTLKSLDWVPLSGAIKDVFQRSGESGKSKAESVEIIKTKLANAGYDISNFDAEYGDVINQFEELNKSEDDFFKAIQGGETFWSFYEKNSEDYKNAKTRADAFTAVDKSPTGLTLAVKNGSLDSNSLLFKDLMNVPEYNAVMQKAQKEKLTEKLKNTKNLSWLTFGELDDIATAQGDKYATDAQKVADDIEWDKLLSSNREGYLASTGELVSKYQELKGVKGRLERKYPNASASFINALLTRESGAIQDDIDRLTAEAAVYETGYSMRMGEKEIVWKAEDIENKQRKAIFTDLFNKKWGDDRLATQAKRQDEQNKINNKAITKWAYKWEDMVGMDKFGNVVSTLEGYNNWASKPWKSPTNFSTKYHDDGSSTVTYYNPKTEKVVQQQFGKDETPLITSDWVKKTGTISGYGWAYDNNTGLDIAIQNGSDFTSSFNWTVVDYLPNNWAYGNSLLVEDSDWNVVQYSHLEGSDLVKGDVVWAGSVLGQAWNTWNVTTKRSDGSYTAVTEEERAQGKGAHLDIVSWKKGTTEYTSATARSSRETEKFLNWGQDEDFSAWDILKALSKVPTTLRNAVAEKENFDIVAKEALTRHNGNLWMAILDVAGWKITGNEKIGGIMSSLVWSKPLSENFSFGSISSWLSSSDANTVLSNIYTVEDDIINNNNQTAWKAFTDRWNIIEVFDKIDSIKQDMENLFTKDDFGKWDGTINNAEQFFWDALIWETDAFGKFKWDIENLFWPIRTERFWANLTAWEKWYVNSFMPSEWDASVNIKAKLDSLLSNTLIQYNAKRKANSLPVITEDWLRNPLSLIEAYENYKPVSIKNSSTNWKGRILPSKLIR